MSDSLTAVAVTAETAAVGGPHDLTALTGARGRSARMPTSVPTAAT